jgi:hypothetical protein
VEVLMKALVSLYRVVGNEAVAEKEIEANEIASNLINQLGFDGSEVYANDTLEITFINYKKILISLYRVAGNEPVAEKETEEMDEVDDLLVQLGINSCEVGFDVYDNFKLKVTFLDFK